MGWSAVRGCLDWSVVPLYLSCIAWTVVYDSIYAFQVAVTSLSSVMWSFIVRINYHALCSQSYFRLCHTLQVQLKESFRFVQGCICQCPGSTLDAVTDITQTLCEDVVDYSRFTMFLSVFFLPICVPAV